MLAVNHALSGPDRRDGLQLLILIHLAYLPVALKNYGLSLTSVGLGTFLGTALVGEAPGSLALVWAGASTSDLVGLLSGEAPPSAGAGPSAVNGGLHPRVLPLLGALLGPAALVLSMVLLGLRVRTYLRAITAAATPTHVRGAYEMIQGP
jgi:hypothetical protein